MKKNKMMRLASVLLVLVMLTTCVISGTFAKYVTSDAETDSARVAKWGVTVQVDGEDAFAEEYDLSAATKTVVSSEAGRNVLAPGTAGDLGYAKIQGQPEVKFDVTIAVDLELEGWLYSDSSVYCPLEITVGTTVFKGNSYATLNEFEAAVEKAVVEALLKTDETSLNQTAANPGNYTGSTATVYAVQYAPNHEFYKNGVEVQVDWAWAFEGNDDVKDTYLGDQADSGNAATISFTIAIQATQVD